MSSYVQRHMGHGGTHHHSCTGQMSPLEEANIWWKSGQHLTYVYMHALQAVLILDVSGHGAAAVVEVVITFVTVCMIQTCADP